MGILTLNKRELIFLDDPQNPVNWSSVKKYSVAALIWSV